MGVVCEIVGDGAIDLFEPKQLEILADRLRRFTAAERMNDRVQRDPCTSGWIPTWSATLQQVVENGHVGLRR